MIGFAAAPFGLLGIPVGIYVAAGSPPTRVGARDRPGVGVASRAAPAIGSGPAVGGFLMLVLADSAGAPGRVLSLSPFRPRRRRAVRSGGPVGVAGLSTVAAAAAVIGLSCYAGGDLAG